MEDNIKTDVMEIKSALVYWIYLALNVAQVTDCCEIGNEPSSSIKG